jgi:hypothetical protein
MRTSILLLAVLATGGLGHGQALTSPAGSEWSHVEALTAGTYIHVLAKRHNLKCSVKKVDEDGLVCLKGSAEVSLPRVEILQVQIISRGKSAALAAGIGVGAGFAVDVALSKGVFDGGKIKGGVAVASGALGGLIVAPLGYFGGWIRHTVYTAAP